MGVSQVGFSANAQLRVLNAFVAASNQRSALQDYETLVDFLPQSVWNHLFNCAEPFGSKFVSIMVHLERLGLTNPSEGTYAMIAAVMLLT